VKASAKGSAKDAKGAGAKTPAAAAKAALAKRDGRDDKGAKGGAKGASAAKGAKAGGKPGADGKKGAPPAPPRKIQVVQLTTLKPGARGTKASVARRATADNSAAAAREPQAATARRRRSAELTPQQLDHFRELLTTRRARLLGDLSLMQDEALKVTAQDNSSDSVADTGTDNYEQDFTLGLIESEEALAREVDQALVRIEQDAFGVCESCQTPIPLARLEILPFARYCVECQQKREGKA
jgi:RNA polymerase-binding protein DksA